MDRESTLGKMEESIVDSISSIKNMDLVNILGLMEEDTLDNG